MKIQKKKKFGGGVGGRGSVAEGGQVGGRVGGGGSGWM